MSAGRDVVKVRIRSHCYSSPPMSHEAAAAIRDHLRQRMTDVGNGPDLVQFVDRSGREIDLRVRDIFVVELGVPESHAGPGQRPPHGFGGNTAANRPPADEGPVPHPSPRDLARRRPSAGGVVVGGRWT